MPLDPGLLRFTAAVRISLATFASCFIVIPVLVHIGQPVIEASPPILFVMMSTMFARDTTLRRRQITVLQSFLGAVVAFVCAAWLEHWPLAGIAGMVLLIGAVTALHTRGVRTFTVGITIVICYYVGLLLHPPLGNQAVMLALLIPALLITLVAFELLPDDPELIGHLMLASIAAQADRVISEAKHPRRDPRRLERHLMQLNRAIAATEVQFSLGDLEGQEATVATLAKLEVAVTHAVLQVEDSSRDAAAEWRRALTELIRAAAEMRRRRAPADAPAAPRAAAPPLAWRSALRVICAATVAACIGYPFSSDHWYWAIITVFVISLGTSSAGDTLQKGMLRLTGTASGAFAGLCVASLVPSHSSLTLVGLAICIFGWAYFILYEYAIGVFFLTLMLGLVYGEFGQNIAEIVGLRLLETLIGAASACAAALWLVPLRTSDHVRARGLALIARLVDVIDASRDALVAGQGGDAPLAAMRRVDQASHDLRLALTPLRASNRLIAPLPRQDVLPGVMICVHWARVLAVAAAAKPTLPEADRDALMARLARLRARFAAAGMTAAGVVGEPIETPAEPPATPAFDSPSANLIAEAADRFYDAFSSLLGRAGDSPREFARALLASGTR
jgi:uncharacterized membrane protein YccC